jgi:hypothetical protein
MNRVNMLGFFVLEKPIFRDWWFWFWVVLLELVERKVEGPDSFQNRRYTCQVILLLLVVLELWFSLRAKACDEVDGEYGEVDKHEKRRGSEPARPHSTHPGLDLTHRARDSEKEREKESFGREDEAKYGKLCYTLFLWLMLKGKVAIYVAQKLQKLLGDLFYFGMAPCFAHVM